MEFTDQPLEPFGERILDLAVPTQLSAKTPLVFRMIKELVNRGCLPWTGSHRAELCLDEALTNAMVHGNKLDPQKIVRISLFADDQRWGVIVEDQGEGFGADHIPSPDEPDFIFRDSGRGIALMDRYFDSLRYNSRGNRLMAVRRRQTEPEEAEARAAVEPEAAPVERPSPVIRSVEDGVVVIEVAVPRITDDTLPQVRDGLKESTREGSLFVLDLSHVEYVSSVGLGVLVSLYKKIRTRNGRMVLACVQPAVMDILESALLTRLFELVPDRRTAVKEVRRGG